MSCGTDNTVIYTNYTNGFCDNVSSISTFTMGQCVSFEGYNAIFNFCSTGGIDLVKEWWFWVSIGGGSLALIAIVVIIYVYYRMNSKYDDYKIIVSS